MPSGNNPLLFVHGFLGLPSDWAAFMRARVDKTADLWQIAREIQPTEEAGFALAARELVKMAQSFDEKPILVGYSLGARLAMHAATLASEKFRAVVLISGHPGLKSEKEKTERQAADQLWAERWRTEPWDEVFKAWNSQAVLAAPKGGAVKSSTCTQPLTRGEVDFDREALARGLDIWSLGRQEDLRSRLGQLRIPTFFLTGAEDTKFTQLTSEMMVDFMSEFHRHIIIPGAGHRLPWDRSDLFVAALRNIIEIGRLRA